MTREIQVHVELADRGELVKDTGIVDEDIRLSMLADGILHHGLSLIEAQQVDHNGCESAQFR